MRFHRVLTPATSPNRRATMAPAKVPAKASRDGSVVVKRFRAGPAGGTVEERRTTRIVTLPKANNVPRYTNYIYSAFENSYVEDEVRRRLLFPDHEGEMLEAGDSEDDSVSDSDSDSGSKSGSGSPGRSPRLSVGATPPSDAADRKAKKKEEERPRKEEEDAEHAAAGPWDRKDDYVLFAAASILGVSDRAIARVAENLKLVPAVVRARLKVLLREPDPAGGGVRRVSPISRAHREAKAKQRAGITSADLFRRAMSEARGARNTVDTRDAAGPSADVDDSKVDAREHVDLGVGFSPAVKEEPAEDALDDEEETEDAAARMERSEDPERPERARRRMAARERKAESARHVGLWNLTAWLLACDDGGVIDEDDGMATSTSTPRWIPSARCTACGVTRTTACCTGAGRHTLR